MNLRTGSCLLLLLNLLLPASSYAAKDGGKLQNHTIFAFGPTSYSNLNSRSMGTIFSAGWSWGLDPQFDLLAVADLGISFKYTDTILLCPQIKGRYLFSDDPESSSTWFVGGGMGLGYAQNHETPSFPKETVTSLAFSLAFGVKLLRKTQTPLFFEIEHLMMMQESRYGTPISTSVKAGISFSTSKKARR